VLLKFGKLFLADSRGLKQLPAADHFRPGWPACIIGAIISGAIISRAIIEALLDHAQRQVLVALGGQNEPELINVGGGEAPVA
jgi:hypothetical protein